MDRIKEVDELFSKWDKKDSPGLALSVAVDGEIIFKKAYGSSNLEYDIQSHHQQSFMWRQYLNNLQLYRYSY